MIPVTKKLIDHLRKHHHAPPVSADASAETLENVYGTKAAALFADGELSADELLSLTEGTKMSSTLSPEKMFSGGSRIRVKDPSEAYGVERHVGVHVKSGKEVFNPFTRRMAELPSDVDHAKIGVLLKHIGQRSGLFNVTLPEHERNLLDEMAHNDEWAGTVGGEYREKIAGGSHIKALIDDATSGGLEATPIFFDDQVVTFPLLTGELLPKVDLRPLDRGRRVEGGSVGNPTISWGQGDATEVGLFNTASLVSALDSTVYGAAVAVEVGRDFLSDAAVDVGAILTANIGQKLQEELDDVIANGNGTTQPEGILTASGLTTINSDNGAGGAPTLNDYISLLFSIGKQYRNRSFTPTFVSNDTTFQRSRAIKIDTAGTSTDQRPALAPLVQINEYNTLGWDHAVQNDIGNRTCVFGALSKFRLYRRAGMEIRFVDGGKELARKNLVLLLARARYAGRVMDTNAFAKWIDGQS